MFFPPKFKLLSFCNSLSSLNEILSFSIINGYIQENNFFAKDIIRKFITSFSDPASAISVYSSIYNPSVLLQNWTLRCLSDHGFDYLLLDLFVVSQALPGCRVDNFTFPIVIKSCAAVKDFHAGKQVHGVVLRRGYGSNVGTQTSLLDMYAKIGSLEDSKKVFDEMPERDLVTWNAMVSGYSLNGYNKEAVSTFNCMLNCFRPNVGSFIGVISSCNGLEELDCGPSLHALVVKCGVAEDEALLSSLISMYSGFEDLSSARSLFDTTQTKDLVAWNAMISGYLHNRKADESLEVFQLMHHVDTRPNLITFVSILASCVDLDDIFFGELVHALGVKLGLADQVSILTALVSMYSKLGDISSAEYLYYSVLEEALILSNCMASGYLIHNLWRLSMDVFRRMQISGIFPDSVSLINVISACTVSQDLLRGKSAHAYSLKLEFLSNLKILNALLAFYFDCGQFSDFHKLFDMMSLRNEVSWNVMISRWAKLKDVESTLASFNKMRQEDVKLNAVSIINALPAFCEPHHLARGISFHSLAVKSGYDSDTSLVNALMSMYTNCSDVAAGCLLFNALSVKSVFSWNVLMTGFRNNSLHEKVMETYKQMKIDGMKPNCITLLNLLPVCETLLQAKSIHAYAVRNFMELESSLLTSVICSYSRFENLKCCQQLFDRSDKGNVIVWNAMMSAYGQNHYTEEAVTTFGEMLKNGLEPDAVTIFNLVSACSQFGNLQLAEATLSFIIRTGFCNNTSVSNSVMDMFARCGSLSIAEDIFASFKEKDSVSWSIMINAYGMHGNGKAAITLFSMMQEASAQPDDVTFLSVLSACSHAGLVREGQKFFEQMLEDYRIVPRKEHYACLVDLLSRTGHLDDAYELLRRMPCMPSTSLLESLLGACHCYGNTAIGDAIGKMLIELNPHSSRSYVVLSNISSAAGRWIDSETVRSDMDGKGVKKDSGFSKYLSF